MNIILGIDPGSRTTGYGVIREESGKIIYLDSGCIRATAPDFSARLLQIFNGVAELMATFKPVEMAIEEAFMHVNPNAALKLGAARGVAMVAGARHNITVAEYAPRMVKKTLAGYGGADKIQVKHMVCKLLSLDGEPQADAADALAIAICHSHMKHAIYRGR